MVRKYNFIFAQLVEDEYDFVGHIAYSLYKQDKVNYIVNHLETQNTEITREELERFHEMSCKDLVINAYKRRAETILKWFVKDTLEELIKEVKEDIIVNHKEVLKSIIKPLIPANKMKQFWLGVLQSTIANLTLYAMLALIILVIYVAKVGFVQAVENIYNLKFTLVN